MFKIYSFLIALIAMFAGCGGVSESGTNAVMQEYGGSLSAKSGVNKSTDTTAAQGRYVELELTNDRLEGAFPKLSIPASNCAYLFYSAVSPAERDKYDYVRITIKGKDNSYSHSYPMKELDAVDMAKNKFDEVGRLLKSENYDDLLLQMDPHYFQPGDLQKVKPMLQDLDKQFGRTGGFKLEGFEFDDYANSGNKQRLITMYSLLTKQRKQALVALTLNTSASISGPNVVGLRM
ncbi:hypothetical protein MON38_01615 [Hymenobacter sp. DH14]|uniref:Lipoprotein n=1 Tax=Hymenobacter cyanobacteriorum TaxID=2926463 RepID=A0A9X2AGS9_9BACT|nr:hypothetical protein [Hymenobacter cyanobacteriorum]MCI1186099.1 hypothetical protein [Hymenobacter cyanobacteriorum]